MSGHQNNQLYDSSNGPQSYDNKSSNHTTIIRQQIASSNVTLDDSSSSAFISDAANLSNIIDDDDDDHRNKDNKEATLQKRKVDLYPSEISPIANRLSLATNAQRQLIGGNNSNIKNETLTKDLGEENQLFKQLTNTSQDGDKFVYYNRDHPTLETAAATWSATNKNSSAILRDCSDQFPTKPLAAANAVVAASLELRASDNRLNIPSETATTTTNIVDKQLLIGDRDSGRDSGRGGKLPSFQLAATGAHHKPLAPVAQSTNLIRLNPGDSRRVHFDSLLESSSTSAGIDSSSSFDVVSLSKDSSGSVNTIKTGLTAATLSLNGFSNSTIDCDINKHSETSRNENNLNQSEILLEEDNLITGEQRKLDNKKEADNKNRQDNYSNSSGEEEDYDDDDEAENNYGNNYSNKSRSSPSYELNRRYRTSSYFKKSQSSSLGRRVLNGIRSLGTLEIAIGGGNNSNTGDIDSRHPYFAYEDKDLLTGSSKYNSSGRKQRRNRATSGRTFRGSYRYSRSYVSMAIFKKLSALLFQRSTAALLGAFLIHVTLGTVYTLSNINSYLTSYMRLHGSPKATYGGSMWISSSYAVGQGFSMVLGGYIEKRFSARVACFIGCAMHSISIMSTSWSVNHGPLAVLVTYGLIPGFGCGLAYMTPMSNGFGWYPNRKGLVAGVILAGFGIGTFVFNMAQTAYVNEDNLSPPEGADGYFTQTAILDKVPHLFVFMGSIYATMQFIGCCLLFKPPNTGGGGCNLVSSDNKLLSDERPILMESEMSLKKAIRAREFIVLFVVYGLTTQGILFVNSMIKEYGQMFIGNDMYLAWTGSMASIANSMGRLVWGLAIDRFTFTQCFTSTTIIFGSLMFIMPFEFVLSSKLWYLVCTLGIFGSFSGWMSIYPVHLSRVFGRTNSGMIYGLIFISQSIGGIGMAFGTHYLIDHFNRFVPFFCMVFLEIVGLSVYHLFYPK